jgi:EAL domain-containing protein (putative c-di-GMP-specific phosphodiesterase class I)
VSTDQDDQVLARLPVYLGKAVVHGLSAATARERWVLAKIIASAKCDTFAKSALSGQLPLLSAATPPGADRGERDINAPRHVQRPATVESSTAGDTSVTVQPRLVPPLAQGPHLPRHGAAHASVVRELGFRPDQGIDAASAGVGLTPWFQPVVSLPGEQVVGFEALARWPTFVTMTAHNVFSFANRSRHADALDQQCIDAAVHAALDSELPRHSLLLINTEPAVAHVPLAKHPALTEAGERFQLAFELTERHMLAHPQALLEKVAAIRADGIAIAVDDVGAHPDSLAVLDIIDPDIIKLDMTMIQNCTMRNKADALTGVLAHHERTGALIIAEGVETDEDLEQALAMGAGFAQGYRFGRARPLCRQPLPAGRPPAVRAERRPRSSAHAAAEDGRRPLRVARQHVVAAFTRHIEEQARHSVDQPIVLAALHRAHDFSAASRELYQELAETSPLVVVLGRDMPADLGGGIRCVELQPDDPLCREWVVVVLGADTCKALVARELADTAKHNGDRRFEFLVTSDRALVAKAARNLLARVV